jgi:hypothetical protein
MKKIHVLVLAFLIYNVSAYCQTASDSISATKVFGGYRYMQHGLTLNSAQLGMILKDNSEAYSVFKKSRTSYVFAMIFAYPGGFLIGWPIGTAIGGGDPNWALAGVGAGLAALAMGLAINSDKQLKHSVEIYNSSIRQSYYPNRKIELELGLHSNGVGLLLKF